MFNELLGIPTRSICSPYSVTRDSDALWIPFYVIVLWEGTKLRCASPDCDVVFWLSLLVYLVASPYDTKHTNKTKFDKSLWINVYYYTPYRGTHSSTRLGCAILVPTGICIPTGGGDAVSTQIHKTPKVTQHDTIRHNTTQHDTATPPRREFRRQTDRRWASSSHISFELRQNYCEID